MLARDARDAATASEARGARRGRSSTPPGRGSTTSSRASPAPTSTPVRLVKGSHIVTPKFWRGPQAYLLQNHDRRVIFVNPVRGRLHADRHDRHSVRRRCRRTSATAEEEIDYLLAGRQSLFPQRAVAAPTSIEPSPACGRCSTTTHGNPPAVTRDYVLEVDAPTARAAALRVRRQDHDLSQTRRARARKARAVLPGGEPATGRRQAALPGGEHPGADFDAFLAEFAARYRCCRPRRADYARRYGARAMELLGDAESLADLGRCFGGRLLRTRGALSDGEEWATTAEDILAVAPSTGSGSAPTS